jgi:DNA-binding PadR family transcriptional regulator
LTIDIQRYIVTYCDVQKKGRKNLMSSYAIHPRWSWAFAKDKDRGPRGRHRRLDDLERMAAVRHLRGGGPPFGFGPGFGPPFGGGRGRARRGNVRIALLQLLAEEPRNGYQLMQEIEERSDGRWRPSPGSVYPALAQLEDEGLIQAAEEAGTKLFEITDAGRAVLEERGERAAPWEFEDDPSMYPQVEVRSLIKQVGIAAWQVVQAGDEAQVKRARDTLAETRRALYRILAEEADATSPPEADARSPQDADA